MDASPAFRCKTWNTKPTRTAKILLHNKAAPSLLREWGAAVTVFIYVGSDLWFQFEDSRGYKIVSNFTPLSFSFLNQNQTFRLPWISFRRKCFLFSSHWRMGSRDSVNKPKPKGVFILSWT